MKVRDEPCPVCNAPEGQPCTGRHPVAGNGTAEHPYVLAASYCGERVDLALGKLEQIVVGRQKITDPVGAPPGIYRGAQCRARWHEGFAPPPGSPPDGSQCSLPIGHDGAHKFTGGT